MKRTLLLILTAGLLPLTTAFSEVVVYQEGGTNAFVTNYAGTSDTIVASTTAVNNENYGGLDFLLVGRNEQRSSIIRFDLSSMAGSYSSISSATLTFTRSGAATLADFDIRVYSIVATNGGWNEMQATWINQDKATPTPWENASGVSQVNILGAQGSLLQTIDYTTATTSISVNVPIAMLLEWINSPNSASSLALMPFGSSGNNANVATLGSSENATAAYRPTLTINYSVIPEPSAFALGLGGIGLLLILRRRFRAGN